jgi:hypothetical protein
MKTDKEIKKELVSFTDNEKQSFQYANKEIQSILESNKLSEDSLKRLSNVITQLNALKESFFWRLLRAAKQNHMID